MTNLHPTLPPRRAVRWASALALSAALLMVGGPSGAAAEGVATSQLLPLLRAIDDLTDEFVAEGVLLPDEAAQVHAATASPTIASLDALHALLKGPVLDRLRALHDAGWQGPDLAQAPVGHEMEAAMLAATGARTPFGQAPAVRLASSSPCEQACDAEYATCLLECVQIGEECWGFGWVCAAVFALCVAICTAVWILCKDDCPKPRVDANVALAPQAGTSFCVVTSLSPTCDFWCTDSGTLAVILGAAGTDPSSIAASCANASPSCTVPSVGTCQDEEQEIPIGLIDVYQGTCGLDLGGDGAALQLPRTTTFSTGVPPLAVGICNW